MMKKRMIKAAFVAAIAFVAGYGVYASQQEVEMSDLEMAKVEALASGEGSSERAYCWTQFTGGLAWPRQCPSCVRLPFSTGIGTTGSCTVR